MSPLRAPGCLARAVLVATLGTVLAGSLPIPPAGAADGWSPPVPGAVVRGYREPLALFASGHRGIDFAAPAGTPVRAANEGRVTFAGDVSGSLHVVIEHSGGIRTSYSFLATADVEVGATVRRGAVIGTAGGHEGSHRVGVLHFGARSGSRYFDPMLLFGPTDLTELVRLAPADRITPSDIELLRRELDDDGCGLICDIGNALAEGADWVVDRVEDAIELGIEALRTVGELTEEVIRRIDQLIRDVMQTLAEVAANVAEAVARFAEMLANGVIEFVEAIVEAGIRLYEGLTSCPQPPPKAHSEGSGNTAFAVGGLTSSIRRRSPDTHGDAYDESFHTRWRPLGYTRDEVVHFSYRDGFHAYRPEDTVTDLHAQAASMGRQIKEWAREHPGESIDLVGHSQGGLVIDLFLLEHYAGHEGEYPPIENVVTFGSPHEGTPLADLAEGIDNHLSIGPTSKAGTSRGRGLNENLAREILELHTLGVSGGYTQADVTALAGPRYQRDDAHPGVVRWGRQRGSIYLADQKLAITVPRVRDRVARVDHLLGRVAEQRGTAKPPLVRSGMPASSSIGIACTNTVSPALNDPILKSPA